MRKILLDKVREDFSHTHPEFNTLQSKPHGVNTSPNTNENTSINTLVNPFTLPSQLLTVPQTHHHQQQHHHQSSPMTQSSIHVIPYNNITSSVPVITNQSIVFPPPLLHTAVPTHNEPIRSLPNSTSASSMSSGDEDEEMMELNIHDPMSVSTSNNTNGSNNNIASSVNNTTTTTTSPEKKRKSTRRTSNTRRRSHSNQSNHSNDQSNTTSAATTSTTTNSSSSSSSDESSHQTMCCIQNCTKDVSNRLRFSLRCETEFKPDYVSKFWNNICNYCYFHDLYQWKKLNQQTDSNNSSSTTPKRKNSSTSNGRKRANSSLSTNSTTSNRSSKSVKSDHQDQIANHHHHDDQQLPTNHLMPHPLPPHTMTPPVANTAATTAVNTSPNSANNHSTATNLKKVNEVKKPLKIDTSFTLSTSLHKSNVPPPSNHVVNNYVDPSPVHKEDVNALLDFLSAASQNN